MAVTSSTTSVAFFANITSPMLPIRAFGVFAVVIVFPPATIIYDKYIHGCCHNLCCLVFCCRKRKIDVVEDTGEQVYTGQEKFFRTHWNAMVKKLRWVIVVST